MTGFHRLPILAIAALLAAGCGANPPTTMPSPSIAAPTEATGSPAATSSASTPVPTPTSCPPLDAGVRTPSAHFTVWTPAGGFSLGLDVTRVGAIGNPDAFVDVEGGPPYLDEPIRLVGGSEISLEPNIDDGGAFDVPITLIAAGAVIRAAGRESIPLDGTVAALPESDEDVFLFDVPDIKTIAFVDFSVEWSDECFIHRAEKTRALEMVRAAFADRCPADHEEFTAYWTGLTDSQVLIGDVGFNLQWSETFGLWTPYTFGTHADGLSTWDPALISTGPAGGVVRVLATNPDLRIRSMSAAFYRRSAVKAWQAFGDLPHQVFMATADPYPDRHLDLLLPPEPRRYVVSVRVQWETPCANGSAVGAISIDVE